MSKKIAFTLPARFDKFELIRELGRGATGAVYLAHQKNLRRDLAIKILLPSFSEDDDFISRFQREGAIAASLNHPNIVQLIDASVFEDQYYITMEYVAGPNLQEIIKREQLPEWYHSVNIACQILSALEHAHGKGIVHRDVKPANILVGENERAVLTDFSVAHMRAASRLTVTGAVLGTPEYMAPEVFGGAPTDALSDIYAVGIILYELLTGVNPFRAKTIPEILKLQLFNVPQSPHVINSQVPSKLSQIIMETLCKEPLERPASAAELARRLSPYRAKPSKAMPATHKIKLGDVENRKVIAAAPVLEVAVVAQPAAGLASGPTVHIPIAESAAPEARGKNRSALWIGAAALIAVALAGAWHARSRPPEAPSMGQVILSASPENVTLEIEAGSFETHHNGDRLSLVPGHYDITASAPGYRAWQHQLVVASDQSVRLAVELQRLQGSLKLTGIEPDVKVLIDGKEALATKKEEIALELPPGSHELKFTRPHYKESILKVEVADAKAAEMVQPKLTPVEASLSLDSSPSRARVFFNGLDQGMTPLKKQRAPGSLKIKLTKAGFLPFEEQTELVAEQSFTKEFKLVPLPAPPVPKEIPVVIERPAPVYRAPYSPPAVARPRPSAPPAGGKFNTI